MAISANWGSFVGVVTLLFWCLYKRPGFLETHAGTLHLQAAPAGNYPT